MNKSFIFDRDHLRQVFSDWRAKELLATHGYKSITELYDTLISRASSGAEYVVGLPGIGKSTFAIKNLGAHTVITQKDMVDLLTMNFDDMVFVTCDVDDAIAQNAGRITLLHTHKERLHAHRKSRDEEIEEGISETAFGRDAHATTHTSTDASITISRLKTDYPDKSRIIFYNNADAHNFDEKKYIAVKNLSNKRKYREEGVVGTNGKFAPPHKIHEEIMQKVIVFAEEKQLHPFALLVKNSGGEYDFDLRQSEKKKLLDPIFGGKLPFLFEGVPKFFKTEHNQIIKVIPEKSFAVLGKERLPEGFTQGSYNELVTHPKYAQFMKSADSVSVKSFAGYNFLNIGNIAREGSDESVSATFVRENLVKGNIDAVRPYLSDEIFSVLTAPHNLAAIKRRYALIQERDEKIEENQELLKEKYRTTHPLTGEKLLTKAGKPTFLARSIIKKGTSAKDKAKILDYIEKIDMLVKKHKKNIIEKYKKKIRSEKNKLDFSVLGK